MYKKAKSSAIFGFFASFGRDTYRAAKGPIQILSRFLLFLLVIFAPLLIVVLLFLSIRNDSFIKVILKSSMVSIIILPIIFCLYFAINLSIDLTSLFHDVLPHRPKDFKYLTMDERKDYDKAREKALSNATSDFTKWYLIIGTNLSFILVTCYSLNEIRKIREATNYHSTTTDRKYSFVKKIKFSLIKKDHVLDYIEINKKLIEFVQYRERRESACTEAKNMIE